ncbi:hypothetical protein Ami103574_15160 [Aminipila butyrica]|uniref:Uncharacterized protein n=1 Tax=Aminipila butyrica TaxID=433296 RepID=A0A858C018_9FIRM|nr:hypothetical protein [Aminipila butyrica]QIB70550.1 hypothetical protein Ami103574_15160 [Aminipila butyrica]
MKADTKKYSAKVDKKKDLSKEELSAYILYSINGCSQVQAEPLRPAFVGSYH